MKGIQTKVRKIKEVPKSNGPNHPNQVSKARFCLGSKVNYYTLYIIH